MIIVNPPSYNPSPFKAIEAPIWCAYLAAYSNADGYTPTILDAEAEGLSIEQTVEKVGFQACILVAMGTNPSASSTPKWLRLMNCARD